MDNLAAYIGRKWRYVGANSANSSNGVYEAEAIGFVPRGRSLYKDFPSFCGYIQFNGAKAVVDVSHKYDRIIMRNPDGKLAAVHPGRIYENLKFDSESVQKTEKFILDLLKETYDNAVNYIVEDINTKLNIFLNKYAEGEWKDTDELGVPIAFLKAEKLHREKGIELSKQNRYYKHPDFEGIAGSREYREVAQFINRKLEATRGPGLYKATYTPKPDADALILKFAQKIVDEVQASYLLRLKEKLWVIVGSKELSDIKLNRVSLTNFYKASFTFTFADGSRFDLESSIVLNTSPLGKYFYQFPNLYKNVKFADGTTAKFVPEASMVTEFAGRTREELKMAQKDLRAIDPRTVQTKKISHLRNTYNITSEDGEFENSTFALSIYDDRITKKLLDVKVLKAIDQKPEIILVTFKDGLSFEARIETAKFLDKYYTRALKFADLKKANIYELKATITKVVNEPQVGAEDAVILKKAAVRIKTNYGIKCLGRVMPGDPINTNDITAKNTISNIELIPPLPKPKLSADNYLGTQVSGKALANIKAIITYTDGKTATVIPKILRYDNIMGKNEWGGQSIVGVGELNYVSGTILHSDIT